MPVTSTLRGTSLILKQKFDAEIKRKYTPARLKYIGELLGMEHIEMIQERTNKGLDRDGRRMTPLSKGYVAQKTKAINNGYRWGRRSLKPKGFAADKATDMMRLSGNMFFDMYVKKVKAAIVNGVFDVMVELDFRTARSRRIAGYHLGEGRVIRKFWGPVKGPQAEARLRRVLKKALR